MEISDRQRGKAYNNVVFRKLNRESFGGRVRRKPRNYITRPYTGLNYAKNQTGGKKSVRVNRRVGKWLVEDPRV